MELNQGQLKAKEAIEYTLKNGGTFTLKGYAGTGKTFLLQQILKDNPGYYALTAPTNKATRVMANMFRGNPLGLKRKPICRTIYSLLGLQLSNDGEVKELVRPDDPIDLSDLDGIFVDEGSMVNELLFNLITEAAHNHGVPLIFIGDPAQLPPVKEEASKVWTAVDNVYELTEIVRYGGPLLNFASELRTQAFRPFPNVPRAQTFDLTRTSISQVSTREFAEIAVREAEDFLYEGEEVSKIICWRNITVDQYNARIRHALFGTTPLPYCVGDKVIFTSPYKNPATGAILATTDEEGIITNLTEEPHPILTQYETICLTIEVDPEIILHIHVIHPSCSRQLERALATEASEAKTQKHRWKDFWALKEAFAEVRHAYAITAHRSQGSTYRRAFINMSDILVNRNRSEALRCLYVASTRARESIVIC